MESICDVSLFSVGRELGGEIRRLPRGRGPSLIAPKASNPCLVE